MCTVNKPYVVCHILASLDGKIDGDFMSAPECRSALAAYENLREFFECSATLYGTVTMAGSYSDGFAKELAASDILYPKDDYIADGTAENYIVSVDPKGILGWESGYIQKKNRPKAHVIEVLTGKVSNDYLAYLRKLGISYIFAGEWRLDCSLLLDKLYRLFAIERLMISGGGIMNESFIQEELIDELSLVIAPLVSDSSASVSIFERADFLAHRPPVAFALKEVEQLDGSSLWLRYTLGR